MYHHTNDSTVPKRAPSYHKNIEGPFYVSDQCITCGLPKDTAPENIDWNCPVGCEECPQSCYVKKQPENDQELESLIEAMLGSEVENIRYCGTNPEVLRRLNAAGYSRLCDAI
jgi:ferredoxin